MRWPRKLLDTALEIDNEDTNVKYTFEEFE